MRIIISGYGRMGREIEKVALEKGYAVVARLDTDEDWQTEKLSGLSADVIIDFSQPDVVLDVIKRCIDMQVPVVTGTTGWYGMLEEITDLCRQKNGTLFYAPNFSIGVNILFKVNETLASLMNRVGGYDVQVKETHHIHKLDKPSGTAISIAEGIIRQMDSLTGWVNDKTDSPSELPVISKRKGEVTGTHTITYNSKADKIVLKHKAKNRSGFALGALAAAAFVKDKKGVYTMDDLLSY
jgi:4-hydroxy-tetrahydrodipicolinate reductase